MSTPAPVSSIPWFKVADFEDLSFWLTFQNTTTMSKPAKSERLELTEVAQRGLTALIPHRLCALGHHISLHFSVRTIDLFDKSKPEREISKQEITAKVDSEERFSPDFKLIGVKFLQYDEKKWQDVLDRLARTQESATVILKRMTE